MNKSELRKIYQSKREELKDIDRLNQQLTDSFFDTVDLSEVSMIHIFLPIESKKEIKPDIVLLI